MFPLAALGAGLGQFAQDYQRQQESALRMMMAQRQMEAFQQQQRQLQQERDAQGAAFRIAGQGGMGGGFGQPAPIQGLGSPMSAPQRPIARAPQQQAAVQPPADFGAAGEYGVGQAPTEPPDTIIPSKPAQGQRYSFDELRQLAQQAGFQGPKADEMAAISLAESGGNPFAHNPKYPDDSYGLTQINALAHGPVAKQALGNPQKAMELAYRISDGGENFRPWSVYTSGAYKQHLPGGSAQADPMTPVMQEIGGGLQRVQQITSPSVYGKMGLQGLVQQIEKAMPGADDAVKYMALEHAQKLLAPDAKIQLELYKEQRQHDWAKELQELQASRSKELTKYGHDLRMSEGSPTVMTDPTTGQQFVYDAKAKKATTLTGEPYNPGGAERVGGGGGSMSDERAKLLAGETRRLDAEWATAHPLATEPEKQQAHFQNRVKAEKILANAKTSSNRISPRTQIFQKAMEEHPDLTLEEMQTYVNNMDLNSKITASFANGDAAKQMRAVNTVADHILRVQDYAEALANKQIPRANQLANMAAKELGRPEVTTFEAGRDIMADEVVRLLTSTGGTEKDREGMQSRISQMMSPEQFAGVFQAFRDFSGARFEALRQQYAHNDPRREKEFTQFLTPAALKVFEGMTPPKALEGSAHGAQPAAAASRPAAAPAAGPPYAVGQIIEKGGKRYRVTGGDPNDPDVEVAP
jgi:hypothetical protein